MKKKIWLVPHPTYVFKEDVKKIAASKQLQVIDAKFKDSIDPDRLAKDTPSLTLKPEYKDTKEKPAEKS